MVEQLTDHTPEREADLLPEADDASSAPGGGSRLAWQRDELLSDSRSSEVIASYIKKREEPAMEDLGFVQQAEIFDFVRDHKRRRCRRSSMRMTRRKIPRECCVLLLRGSRRGVYRSMFSWSPGCATPTGSGRSIGTAKWRDRQGSSHTSPSHDEVPKAFMRNLQAPPRTV